MEFPGLFDDHHHCCCSLILLFDFVLFPSSSSSLSILTVLMLIGNVTDSVALMASFIHLKNSDLAFAEYERLKKEKIKTFELTYGFLLEVKNAKPTPHTHTHALY